MCLNKIISSSSSGRDVHETNPYSTTCATSTHYGLLVISASMVIICSGLLCIHV